MSMWIMEATQSVSDDYAPGLIPSSSSSIAVGFPSDDEPLPDTFKRFSLETKLMLGALVHTERYINDAALARHYVTPLAAFVRRLNQVSGRWIADLRMVHQSLPDVDGAVTPSFHEHALETCSIRVQALWSLLAGRDRDLLNSVPLEKRLENFARIAVSRLQECNDGWHFPKLDYVGLCKRIDFEATKVEELRLRGRETPPACQAKASANPSAVDRWHFAKPLREKNVSWKVIAEQWRRNTGEPVDDKAFEVDCGRARRAEAG